MSSETADVLIIGAGASAGIRLSLADTRAYCLFRTGRLGQSAIIQVMKRLGVGSTLQRNPTSACRRLPDQLR